MLGFIWRPLEIFPNTSYSSDRCKKPQWGAIGCMQNLFPKAHLYLA